MKRTTYILFILLFIQNVLNAQEFDIKNAPVPLFRDPIFDGPTDPTVIYDKKNKEWVMYYTQRRANQECQGVSWVFGCDLGIAKSKDNGRSWYYWGTAQGLDFDQGKNTFWAPDLAYKDGKYHLFVTYIKGVWHFWGGDAKLIHMVSDDLINWEFSDYVNSPVGCIDASVHKVGDKWKIWFTEHSQTSVAVSDELKNWEFQKKQALVDVGHEGPVVFNWKGKYWMVVDPRDLGMAGLRIYESEDAINWTFNADLLNYVGTKKGDTDQGRHCDVAVVGDKAYMFYFTHPGRKYDEKDVEIFEDSYAYRKSAIQVVELELKNGKVVVERDKYRK
jgi:beta-xylosidase